MASSSAKPEPDPALKAKLASLVSRLTAELGVGGGRSAEGLATASVAMLSKMISPYDVTKVSVQQSQKALAASAPDPEAFAAHYARLKAMRVREVDKYLAVVAKIAGDPDLLAAVTAPRVSESDAAAAASPSAYAASEHAAVSEVTSADVSSLPVDGFSFQTNPLASEAASPGPRAADPSAPRGARRRIGDASISGIQTTRTTARSRWPRRARACARSTSAARGVDWGVVVGVVVSPPRRRRRRRRRRAPPTSGGGVDFPRLPEWTRRRPYLTGAHLGAPRAFVTPGKPLREYSAACQELLVVDDLLYAALGVDGRFVVARRGENGDEISFEIEPGLEGSLHALAREALLWRVRGGGGGVLRGGVGVVRDKGWCANHFAAEMEEMLHDWRVMVVQLEHQRNAGRLSLQSLWFDARPAAGALATLAATARKVRAGDLRGAGLLNALHTHTHTRAAIHARTLTLRLLGAASKPYVRAVERWVYEGVVDDPYDEFLVLPAGDLRKESLADEYNAKYWDRRYSLRPETPRFLNGALARKALTTGKYIDAARESWDTTRRARRARDRDERARAAETRATRGDLKSALRRQGERRETFAEDGVDFALPPRPETGLGRVALDAFATGRDGGEMAERIERAFEHASATLLGAVLDDGDLRARLRSLKKYFLTHQGDFLVHFVDIAGAELGRPAGRQRRAPAEHAGALAEGGRFHRRERPARRPNDVRAGETGHHAAAAR